MAEWRFLAANEMVVEGLHAVTKRGIAKTPHFSSVHLALLHHLPELQGYIATEEGLQHFAGMCDKVRTAEGCVLQLGILGHPMVQDMLTQGKGTKALGAGGG